MKTLKTDSEIQKLVDGYGDWFKNGCENRAGNAARMTSELYPYTSIFSPIRVNRMTIKNMPIKSQINARPATCRSQESRPKITAGIRSRIFHRQL